jgi:hypothetical protein
MLPSTKTLEVLTGRYCRIESKDGAKLLRKVLECKNRDELASLIESNREHFGDYTVSSSDMRYRDLQTLKLDTASYLTHGCGVEYISRGHNAKSPSIEYVNHGDPYKVTLMWTRGRYVVGCWGDIVERGNYD